MENPKYKEIFQKRKREYNQSKTNTKGEYPTSVRIRHVVICNEGVHLVSERNTCSPT